MKIKNIDLISINQILNTYAEKKLPQKISFAITKNMMILSKDLEVYFKSLQKILDEYKEFYKKNQNGETVNLPIGVPEVDEGHMEEYIKELDELLGIEIEIELYTIDESVFDYDDTSGRYDVLTASDIIQLQNILCYKEEESKEV